MLRIGEFARLSRVSIRMLRHYDQLGLLVPAHVDPATGYRYYRASQLRALHRIVALRDLGFGLQEIGRALHTDDAPAYQRREEDLVAQLETTAMQLSALRARRTVAGADVVIRTVPTERVAAVPAPRGSDVEEIFEALESFVADQHARADRPPLTLLDASSVTVAVPVSRPVPATTLPNGHAVRTLTLPSSTMACSVHNGPYGELVGILQAMLRWLEQTGRRPAGPLREVYLRFGAGADLHLPPTHVVDDSDPGYVTELQLPCAGVTVVQSSSNARLS